MKTNERSWQRAAGVFTAVLCLTVHCVYAQPAPSATAADVPPAPVITGLEPAESGLLIQVTVPAGTGRVVLESSDRGDLRGWLPKAVAHPTANQTEVLFSVPWASGAEMFRVKTAAGVSLPAPTRAQAGGPKPQWPAPASVVVTNGKPVLPSNLEPASVGSAAFLTADFDRWLYPPMTWAVRVGDWVIQVAESELRIAEAKNDAPIRHLDQPPLIGSAVGFQILDNRYAAVLENCSGSPANRSMALEIFDLQSLPVRRIGLWRGSGYPADFAWIGRDRLMVANHTAASWGSGGQSWTTLLDLSDPTAPRVLDQVDTSAEQQASFSNGDRFVTRAWTNDLVRFTFHWLENDRWRSDVRTEPASSNHPWPIWLGDRLVEFTLVSNPTNDSSRQVQGRSLAFPPGSGPGPWQPLPAMPETDTEWPVFFGHALAFENHASNQVTVLRFPDAGPGETVTSTGALTRPKDYVETVGDYGLVHRWTASRQPVDLELHRLRTDGTFTRLATFPAAAEFAHSLQLVDDRLYLCLAADPSLDPDLTRWASISLAEGDGYALTPLDHIPQAMVYDTLIPGSPDLSSGNSRLTSYPTTNGIPGATSLDFSDQIKQMVTFGPWRIDVGSTGGVAVVPAVAGGPVLATTSLGSWAFPLASTLRGDRFYVLSQTNWDMGNVFFHPANSVSPPRHFRLTTFDLSRLPEISVAATTDFPWTPTTPSQITPLWPDDATLVWAGHAAPVLVNSWNRFLPITYLFNVPSDSIPVSLPFIDDRISYRKPFPLVTAQPNWSPSLPSAPAREFAVFHIEPTGPRLASTLSLTNPATSLDPAFAEGGLVFQGRTRVEPTVIATNYVATYQHGTGLKVKSRLLTNVVAVPTNGLVTNTVSVDQSIPLRRVGSIPGPITDLAAGTFFSAALGADGRLYTWGMDSSRQLGNGSGAPRATPMPVELAGIARFAAGAESVFALDTNGSAHTWGLLPQLPLTNASAGPPMPVTLQPTPLALAGFPAFTAVASGRTFTLGVDDSRQLWIWGDNGGALGAGDGTNVFQPRCLAELGLVRAVAAGSYHSLVLRDDGVVLASGLNSHGQLGNGTTANTNRFTAVEGLPPIRAIAAGTYTSAALDGDGRVWIWGRLPSAALLGTNAAPRLRPALAPIPEPIAALDMENLHLALLGVSGQVWSWGGTELWTGAQLDGWPLDQAVPVPGLSNAVRVAAGRSHGLAVLADGSLTAWGSDDAQQLGTGDTIVGAYQGSRVQFRTGITYTTNIVTTTEWVTELAGTWTTNAIPVFRWDRKHYVDIVDLSQGADDPLFRPSLELPGPLAHVSDGGALLYTMQSTTLAGIPAAPLLSVLYYDDLELELVDTLGFGDGVQLVGYDARQRDFWLRLKTAGSSNTDSTLETWTLDSEGWNRLGRLTVPWPAPKGRLINDLYVVGSGNELWLLDAGDPEHLLVRASGEQWACGAVDLSPSMTGSLATGAAVPFNGPFLWRVRPVAP